MGFGKLLANLAGCSDRVGLGFLEGKRIAIDGVLGFAQFSGLWPSSKQADIVNRLLKVCAFVYVVCDGRRLPCKQAVKDGYACRTGPEDGAQTAESSLATVDELNSEFGARNFCAFVAPYENDQQLAQLYYAGRVDLVVSRDSDMLVYGLPMVSRLPGGGFQYFPADALRRAAGASGLSVEDFLVDAVQECGCDYFRTRAQKLLCRGPSSDAADCAGLFRDLLQALYQFFYQPVFCTESGHVESLRPVPVLERRLCAFLPASVLGAFELPGYVPVSLAWVPWLQAKLAAAPVSAYLPAWPYRSDSIFEAFGVWARHGDISRLRFRDHVACIGWGTSGARAVGAYVLPQVGLQ